MEPSAPPPDADTVAAAGHPNGETALEQRVRRSDALLQAVAESARRLLRDGATSATIDDVLERLGAATGVSRVYHFDNHLDPDGVRRASQRHEWCAPGVEPQLDAPELQGLDYRELGFGRWVDELEAGRVIAGPVDTLPPSEEEFLREQDIQSIVVVPIVDEQEWLGFIGFDDCAAPRTWRDAEVDSLHAIASALGAAMTRDRAEHELRSSREVYLQAYERERLARTRQAELDAMQQEFIEAVSHELRTPLTGILGFAETIEGRVGEDAGLRLLLDRLTANVHRLDELLVDVLELQRLRRGEDRPVPQLTPTAPLVDAVVDLVDLRATHEVVAEVGADEIEVDPASWTQVLRAMLENVRRHAGDAGKVVIGVHEDAAGRCVLRVEDDGPGIPEDERALVFQPFRHGSGIDRARPGTGIGLTLVRHVAELHGGSAAIGESRFGGCAVTATFGRPGSLSPRPTG